MRLQQLHLILSLRETGSLRASAEALHVSQPALTKALKLLEEEFGASLVLRGAKGVRLTPAGEMLAARSATALRELERAKEEVSALSGHMGGNVSLGLSPAAAMLIAPFAISRFSAKWPEVHIRVIDTLFPRSLAQVRAGELDLVIGPIPNGAVFQDVMVRPLFEYRHLIVTRKNHRLAKTRRLAQLAQGPWIRIGPPGGPGDPKRAEFEALGLLNPRVQMQCESFSTLLSLMPNIDMLGIMPSGFFERYGQREGLVALPIQDELPTINVCVASRADAPLTPQAERMLEAILSESATYARAGSKALKLSGVVGASK
jgi:LysR family transcriptional regulator, regulator of abg operon